MTCCPEHAVGVVLCRPQVHDGTYTPADQFLKDPDSLCSTVTWKDEEDRVIWVYRIQVGHGDDRSPVSSSAAISTNSYRSGHM